MKVKDFEPYPFVTTLKKALEMSPNLMLKLPKNMDIDDLIIEVLKCYIEKNPKFIEKNEFINIQIEEFFDNNRFKYYMILFGNIVW